MKFCKNCEKNTPTSEKTGIEECMVCGTPLVELKSAQKIQEITQKAVFIPKSTPEIKQKVKDIEKYKPSYEYSDYFPSGGAILGGIMVMIVGFATLTIGNYLITAIAGSFESIGSSSVSSLEITSIVQKSELINYLTAVFPLVGLALMVLGFATILFSLRGSMSGDYR